MTHIVKLTWNKAERAYCETCGHAVRRTADGWVHE